MSLFTLPDNIVSRFVVLFFKNITKLFFLIRINFRKNRNFRKNWSEFLSSFICGFFDHMLECLSIQTIKRSSFCAFYRCGSWSIVHESKFTEWFPSFIGFQVCVGSIDIFITFVLSWANNIECKTFITLDNNIISLIFVLDWHGIDDNIDIFICECVEKNRFFQKFPYNFFSFIWFFYDIGNKMLFFVKSSIYLSTDALSTDFFEMFVLFQFLLELSIHFFFVFITVFLVGEGLFHFPLLWNKEKVQMRLQT